MSRSECDAQRHADLVHYGACFLGYALEGRTPDLLGQDVMGLFNTLNCSLPTQFLLKGWSTAYTF